MKKNFVIKDLVTCKYYGEVDGGQATFCSILQATEFPTYEEAEVEVAFLLTSKRHRYFHIMGVFN